ncbi:hypothetical protein D3C78_1370310 [compost metagenome]
MRQRLLQVGDQLAHRRAVAIDDLEFGVERLGRLRGRDLQSVVQKRWRLPAALPRQLGAAPVRAAQLQHGAAADAAYRPARQQVVMQDPAAVFQALHVDFNAVPAARIRRADGRQRILGQRGRTAMRVHLHAQASRAGVRPGQYRGQRRDHQAPSLHRRDIRT